MISDKEHENRIEHNQHDHRGLRVESLESRNLLAADLDDSLSEARPLGVVTEQPISAAAEISEAADVDMYRVTLESGQSIDIDVDTPNNGPGGLGGYLRVFNDQGVELAANNDAMGPDDAAPGFDPYIRFTAAQNGNFYIAVSNWENSQFDPIGGEGDVAGQQYATGSYLLTVKGIPQFDSDDAISEAITLGGAGPTPYSVDGVIDNDVDVDMFRLELRNGQSVAFDIDTAQNGPGGLGSYLTLFDANGNVVATNNDGAAPGESLGFDAYLQLSVAVGGPYYLAVSNYGNTSFSPITGSGDTSGSMYATGAYRLTISEVLQNAVTSSSGSTSNADQAAPMIDSMFANSSLSTSQPGLGANTADSGSGPLMADSLDNSLGSSAQVNENLNLQTLATPPILSPSSAFGTLDATAMSLSAAAVGTSAFNFGPGQSVLSNPIDTRSAVATDLALMQSI